MSSSLQCSPLSWRRHAILPGNLQLGGLMQTASAFGRVQDALSWFIGAYAQLAEWKATVDRLTGFHHAIVTAGNEAKTRAVTTVRANGNAELTVRDLRLALPDGRILLDGINTSFKPGEHVLVSGPSQPGMPVASSGVLRDE